VAQPKAAPTRAARPLIIQPTDQEKMKYLGASPRFEHIPGGSTILGITYPNPDHSLLEEIKVAGQRLALALAARYTTDPTSVTFAMRDRPSEPYYALCHYTPLISPKDIRPSSVFTQDNQIVILWQGQARPIAFVTFERGIHPIGHVDTIDRGNTKQLKYSLTNGQIKSEIERENFTRCIAFNTTAPQSAALRTSPAQWWIKDDRTFIHHFVPSPFATTTKRGFPVMQDIPSHKLATFAKEIGSQMFSVYPVLQSGSEIVQLQVQNIPIKSDAFAQIPAEHPPIIVIPTAIGHQIAYAFDLSDQLNPKYKPLQLTTTTPIRVWDVQSKALIRRQVQIHQASIEVKSGKDLIPTEFTVTDVPVYSQDRTIAAPKFSDLPGRAEFMTPPALEQRLKDTGDRGMAVNAQIFQVGLGKRTIHLEVSPLPEGHIPIASFPHMIIRLDSNGKKILYALRQSQKGTQYLRVVANEKNIGTYAAYNGQRLAPTALHATNGVIAAHPDDEIQWSITDQPVIYASPAPKAPPKATTPQRKGTPGSPWRRT
jgi:hypothetical protein